MSYKVREIIEETKELNIPLTVPIDKHEVYRENYLTATRSSGRLFLFAGDQKIEHLNDDFYGDGIPPECASPKHLFEIASNSRVGVFAAQLGLVSRYANDYRTIPYVIKLNSKTNLIPTSQKDPDSKLLNSVEQVMSVKKNSGIPILGVGYTIYLGSESEGKMLHEAAKIIYEAHQHGLIVILWIYPRGKAVKQEREPNLIAGAAGVAASLGADFVKLNSPQADTGFEQASLLKQATFAAGRTKIVCSGGSLIDSSEFLATLYHHIHEGGIMGSAVGRNIHQKSREDAIAFCEAIASIIFDDMTFEEAVKLLD